MPINLGDAVLTFVGDTTQLDAAFDKVGAEAPTKLAPAAAAATSVGTALDQAGIKGVEAGGAISGAWTRVAVAAKESKDANYQLSLVLNTIKQNGLQDAEAMGALAQAQQRAAAAALELAAAQRAAKGATELTRAEVREATGTFAVGGEMMGVTIPRHIRTMLASMGPIGTIMSAAFSAVAVLFLIDLLVKGVEKLEAWRKQAELLREQWEVIDNDFYKTSQSIQHEIDQQEQKFIELTQGPVAALDFALHHLASTAEEVFSKVSAEVDKASSQMESQKHIWNIWGEASDDLKKFGADLSSTMRKAAEEAPGDTTAAYRAGLKVTEEAIRETRKEIDELKQSEEELKQTEVGGTNLDLTPLEKKLSLLEQINQQLKKGQELDEQQRRTEAEQEAAAQRQRTLEVGSAEINARKAIADARIALDSETSKILYERGQISYDQRLQQEKDFEAQRYTTERNGLTQRLELLQEDPTKNESAIKETQGRIKALDISHQLEMTKIDATAYRQRATDFVEFMNLEIADTKEGTQERVDLELGLAEFYKQTWGTQSIQYQQQLVKIAEARRALANEQKLIAREETKAEEELAADKASFQVKYYQYLVQTARASQASLLLVQQEAAETEYQRKKAALEKQLRELGPEEELARKTVLAHLALLDQQHEENRRLLALQTQDVLETYYKELGLKSEELYQREEKVAADAYAHILLSGTAAYGAILKAKQALLNSQLDVARSLGDPAEVQRITAELAKLEALMEKMGVTAKKTQTSMVGWLDAFGIRLKASRGELSGYQQVFDTVLSDLTNVIGSSFAKWIQGQESFGQALRQGLAEELAVIAGKSLAWSLYFLAWGIADTFWNPPRAGADFAAAAEFAAIAAVSGAAAYGLRGSTSSGTGTSIAGTGISENNAPEPASAPAPTTPQPVQTTNVQKFAAGGLMMAGEVITEIVQGSRGGIGGPRQPKLAIYDEGDAEAHVPLPNGRSIPLTINPDGSPAAKLPGGRTIPAHVEGNFSQKFAAGGVISRYADGGLVTTNTLSSLRESIQTGQQSKNEVAAAASVQQESHLTEQLIQAIEEKDNGVKIHVDGMISPDNLGKVVKKINRKVNKGQTRLVSSTALRVTRKG